MLDHLDVGTAGGQVRPPGHFRAMVEGDPVEGYLPSGTVTGVIEDRPRCAELVERIVEEAERTLQRLEKRRS